MEVKTAREKIKTAKALWEKGGAKNVKLKDLIKKKIESKVGPR